jgi:hypothetical protein
MQKATRPRTTLTAPLDIYGDSSHLGYQQPPQNQTQNQSDYCLLPTSEENKSHEIDWLMNEYNQLSNRLQHVKNQLQKLGFHT